VTLTCFKEVSQIKGTKGLAEGLGRTLYWFGFYAGCDCLQAARQTDVEQSRPGIGEGLNGLLLFFVEVKASRSLEANTVTKSTGHQRAQASNKI
jgi:hypothetical protein